jgi:hypothetical protein
MTISLDLDPAFADFNFSEGWDPTLRQGPASSTLYKLVCDARRGNRLAASDFADTIYWTLRPETWDCFQRVHGARPITHREWFFAKVAQFLDILVYDQLTIVGSDGQPRKLQPNEVLTDETTIWRGSGPLIQSDEIERALVAEEWATYQWLDLLQNVSDKREDRAGAVQAWLRDQRLAHQGDPTSRPRIGWTKNEKRDQIILHSLGRGSAPLSICEELDRRGIPTLPALQKKNISWWKDGWAEPRPRNAIQQLFSKVQKRKPPVKPGVVS